MKREKQIMAECDCLFMVNLVTSFKDEAHLYLLLECVMGGELFTYLQVRVRIAPFHALIPAHQQRTWYACEYVVVKALLASPTTDHGRA